MNNIILNKIAQIFSAIGDKELTGHKAASIISYVIDKLYIPRDVEEAKRYISDCRSDLGFMGSPEYYRKMNIVDEYNASMANRSSEIKEYITRIVDGSFEGSSDDYSEEFQEHEVEDSEGQGQEYNQTADDIRLMELGKRLDDVLENETKESLGEWLNQKRK